MRIGLWIEDEERRIDEIAAAGRTAADSGISRIWFSQRTGWDSLTLIAALGPLVPKVKLAVGVVPVYPRHPIALAAQALSVQAATGNRLTLGIGSSHQVMMEGQYGLSMDQPAKYMREYVSALTPLLHGESVAYQGEKLTAVGQLSVPDAAAPEVIVAALGPRMLRIAGELTDGTVTTWATPEVIADYIRPTIDRAALGRPHPQVIACSCVAVTDDADGARQWIADHYGPAAGLPAYRAIMDRGAAAGPADTAVIGDEDEVARQLQRFADAGTTEFMFAPVGGPDVQARTIALALDLARTTPHRATA
ncbi:F420-dependent oxidoreductase-like protein [Kribbella sp. VKM Ac-2527]|uniref:F420-dependent oxidoreductase-like protein n=1 Tax=Kribbella caucasensis TaxID=2512215 RepID=A0A4R6KHZ2_9ACTN|nr:TIGR03564 family F420-dependent LLM class oxidoreductase [Kribbella sp. VKM Ac-2527]TDO50700.1 F420-dependent oxidoreductase-like protein [Kribbella sp. VKM Ac-2527]